MKNIWALPVSENSSYIGDTYVMITDPKNGTVTSNLFMDGMVSTGLMDYTGREVHSTTGHSWQLGLERVRLGIEASIIG